MTAKPSKRPRLLKKRAKAEEKSIEQIVSEILREGPKPESEETERPEETEKTEGDVGKIWEKELKVKREEDEGSVEEAVEKTAKEKKAMAKPEVPRASMPFHVSLAPEVIKERIETKKIRRIATGIQGLDEMTSGGFEEESIIIVNGDPGAGKTIFGLQFLYGGAVAGEAALYLSFGGEPRELLYPRMATLGMDFQKLEDKKKFFIIEYQPHEIAKLFQEEGGTIHDIVTAYGVKRIVIDPITPYLTQFGNLYDARLALVRLVQIVRRWGATTMLLNEVSTNIPQHPSAALAEFLADGVINLIHRRSADGIQIRGVEIWKLCGVSHSEIIRPFEIKKKGVIIYPSERIFAKTE